MSTTRRRFLSQSIAATSAVALTGAIAGKSVSPSEKINVACMGVRGRGDSVMRTFAAQPDVNITHICDVDRNVLQSRAARMGKVKTTVDFREVIDDPNVDVLVVTTPDHWHAIPTIAACVAGKDVYVEKPDGHNILEGKTMLDAARQHGRMVQMGTQARSAPYLHDAVEYVKRGSIGKVLFGKAWETARQGTIPRVPDTDPPKHVDYDRWLGPAPKRQFNRYRFHGNWRWFFDYGCGDLGNDGVHRLDYCRMVMGINEYPKKIACMGGKLFFDDAQEWPDTMMATYEFGDEATKTKKIMTYEMRLWSRPRKLGITEGASVHGDNGWVVITNKGWKAYDANNKTVKEGGDNEAQSRHVRNFLDAVKSRDRNSLNQEIESGHMSSVLCHAGNIAWRVGKTIAFDPKSHRFDDTDANKYLTRDYRKGYELPRL